MRAPARGCEPTRRGRSERRGRRLGHRSHRAPVRRQGARLRPPCASPSRPARGADPGARRRARREWRQGRARATPPRRRSDRMGEAAAGERLAPDRRGDARPRLSSGGRQGGSDPRANGGAAGAPRRGAGEPARLLPRREGRGGGRLRISLRRLMLDPQVEARSWDKQLALDDLAYRAQLAYLLERSPFYREKLERSSPDDAGGLAEIAGLPLTEKPELKATATEENPVGAHLCVDRSEIVRIYSTSGTTGTPSYIPLTKRDLDDWVTGSARSYAASGITAGQRIVSTYNAGPFVAGAALASFDLIGLCHIPVGTGNTERLVRAIQLLEPEAAVLTPSYAAHLLEWAAARDVDLRAASVRRILVAGEPGGGEPAFRAALEDGWGARVTEAMGIGDIGVSLWGECEAQDGMHLGPRGYVHPELIDPESGNAVAMEDEARGELVLTHLRHRAAPLLRFRTRDHGVVRTSPCPCGRTGPRVRCIGRTDDMLIVRGVNVFPSAVREVVRPFAARGSAQIAIRPGAAGVKQEPPLPVEVELARGRAPDGALADSIRERLRSVLVVQTRVELVPWGSLARKEHNT